MSPMGPWHPGMRGPSVTAPVQLWELGSGEQRPGAMSWPRATERQSPLCHQGGGGDLCPVLSLFVADDPAPMLPLQDSGGQPGPRPTSPPPALLLLSLLQTKALRAATSLAVGETSWHGLSAAAGWPGRAVPACAGSARGRGCPNARVTLDLCRFPWRNERQGGLTYLFPARAAWRAVRRRSDSLPATERADRSGWSAAARGQGRGCDFLPGGGHSRGKEPGWSGLAFTVKP